MEKGRGSLFLSNSETPPTAQKEGRMGGETGEIVMAQKYFLGFGGGGRRGRSLKRREEEEGTWIKSTFFFLFLPLGGRVKKSLFMLFFFPPSFFLAKVFFVERVEGGGGKCQDEIVANMESRKNDDNDVILYFPSHKFSPFPSLLFVGGKEGRRKKSNNLPLLFCLFILILLLLSFLSFSGCC